LKTKKDGDCDCCEVLKKKYKGLKRHTRTLQREIDRFNKDVKTGKLVPYGQVVEQNEEAKEKVLKSLCPRCGSGLDEVELGTADGRERIQVICQNRCGYQKKTKISTPTLS